MKVNTKFYKMKGMNDMRNKEIRNAMKQKGITQWKLGELLGVSENTASFLSVSVQQQHQE